MLAGIRLGNLQYYFPTRADLVGQLPHDGVVAVGRVELDVQRLRARGREFGFGDAEAVQGTFEGSHLTTSVVIRA